MYKLLVLIFIFTGISNAELIKEYYDTGELKVVFNSEYGVLNGKAKNYYKNGKLKQTFIMKNDKAQRETIVRYFYDGRDTYTLSNDTSTVPSVLKKNNKLYTGTFILTFESIDTGFLEGTTKVEFHVKNGQNVGKYTFYYRDGSVEDVGYFKNGLRHGKYISYTDKGIKMLIRNYQIGKRDGLEVHYHYNSYTKSSETKYKNNEKHGSSKTYFENGNLSSETVFIRDKENGTHIEYWENGLISNKITMKDGKAISGTWWHENGEIGGAMTNAQFKGFRLDY